MIDKKYRRGLALTGAIAGCMALAACDETTNIAPQATTTPASTTTTEADPVEPAPKPTEPAQVLASTVSANTQTQESAPTPPRTAAQQQQLTPDQIRKQRERQMLEGQGVVFSDDPGAQPRILVKGGDEQHAGVIYARDAVDFEFQLTNAGTSDLVISRISASCGCTVPDRTGLIDTPFEPGADLPPLKVAYTPKNTGNSSKVVTIFTNDPATPVLRLRVGANLAALAQAVPSQIRPGELRAGRDHTVRFDVMSYDPYATIEKITLPNMEGMVEFRALDTQPVEEPNSEFKSRIPVEVIFPARLGVQKIAGGVQVEVRATPPGASEPVISLVNAQLVVNLAGDLRFTRPFARLQLVEEGKPYTFSSNITTASGTEFEITRVAAFDRQTRREIPLTVSWERVEQARIPTWRLRVEGVTPERTVNGELVVHTNIENEPPAKMTFSGFIPPNRNNNAANNFRNQSGGTTVRPGSGSQ